MEQLVMPQIPDSLNWVIWVAGFLALPEFMRTFRGFIFNRDQRKNGGMLEAVQSIANMQVTLADKFNDMSARNNETDKIILVMLEKHFKDDVEYKLLVRQMHNRIFQESIK